MKKYMKILFILLVFCALAGCQYSEKDEGNVQVIVAQDFGNERITSQLFKINAGDTVLDVMVDHYDIETAYGGSFINGINGLTSKFTNQKKRIKVDWFFYVNGILSQVGSGDYELQSKDIIIWDYHNWEQTSYISSIIGAYPQNFISNDYGEALELNILYLKGYQKAAQKIGNYLDEKGVKVHITKVQEVLLEDEASNSIVIGDWDTAMQYEYIRKLYENRDRAGLFFEIDDHVKALDSEGNIKKTFDKGAIIASTLKGYHNMSTLWLVTGNDKTLIQEGAKKLYEDPEQIRGVFSMMLTEDEHIKLPLEE